MLLNLCDQLFRQSCYNSLEFDVGDELVHALVISLQMRQVFLRVFNLLSFYRLLVK